MPRHEHNIIKNRGMSGLGSVIDDANPLSSLYIPLRVDGTTVSLSIRKSWKITTYTALPQTCLRLE